MVLEITFKDEMIKSHNEFFTQNPLEKIVRFKERDVWVKTIGTGYNYEIGQPTYYHYLCANAFERSRGEEPEVMWRMEDIEDWRTYAWTVNDYHNLIDDIEPLWLYHDRKSEKRIDHMLHIMEHCIGLDHKKPYKRHGKLFYRPYRNYFSTREDIVWQALTDKGYANMYSKSGDIGCYEVTDKGREWLGCLIGVKIYPEDD